VIHDGETVGRSYRMKADRVPRIGVLIGGDEPLRA